MLDSFLISDVGRNVIFHGKLKIILKMFFEIQKLTNLLSSLSH